MVSVQWPAIWGLASSLGITIKHPGNSRWGPEMQLSAEAYFGRQYLRTDDTQLGPAGWAITERPRRVSSIGIHLPERSAFLPPPTLLPSCPFNSKLEPGRFLDPFLPVLTNYLVPCLKKWNYGHLPIH